MGLLTIQVFSVNLSVAEDDVLAPKPVNPDDTALCLRAARATVDGFERENPNKHGFLKLNDVKVAFPTEGGVICQALFETADGREPHNNVFVVRRAEGGKITLCSRQGQCTTPLD